MSRLIGSWVHRLGVPFLNLRFPYFSDSRDFHSRVFSVPVVVLGTGSNPPASGPKVSLTGDSGDCQTVVSQASQSYHKTLVMPHWNMYIRCVKKWTTCRYAKPSTSLTRLRGLRQFSNPIYPNIRLYRHHILLLAEYVVLLITIPARSYTITVSYYPTTPTPLHEWHLHISPHPARPLSVCNKHRCLDLRKTRFQIGVNTCCGIGAQLYANCSKTPCLVKVTRCSAIAERPRCRVRYSFRQK